MEIRKKLKTATRLVKEKNWSELSRKIKLRRRDRRDAKNYQTWVLKHKLTENDRRKIRSEINDFSHAPLISVILPVYNVDVKWLRLCIESVLKQLYQNWELCIADDNSPNPQIRTVLEEYAALDARIKVVFRTENGHISAASNSALSLATGEFCALLDHDDELAEDALFYIAREINEFPETAMIYSDEDMIDENGRRFQPKFKPDFSRDFFYSLNLITHLAAYRTSILRKINGFRTGFEGSQDYDLALRFSEQISEKQIRHIPRILYHWRAIRGSVALSSDEKPYAHERARRAIHEHLARLGKKAEVSQTILNYHRVQYQTPQNLPKVTLILSANEDFEAAEKSVRFFFEETDYQNFEIILICPENSKTAALDGNFKTIIRKNSSKAESLNQAVSESSGEILCFADAALRPVSKDWLKELTSFAIQKEIGAVGGKILDKNENISGGGLVLMSGDLMDAAHRGLPREAAGNMNRAQLINNFSAVSAECFAVRRASFEEIGGFDAKNLPDSLFDADFCLRLQRERDLRTVFTPYAELIEIEKNASSNKPSAKESEFFKQKWQSVLEKDPFYNPNLSLVNETFTIEI
jgi:glycosyltransferase involved in cell wall biosynthesis